MSDNQESTGGPRNSQANTLAELDYLRKLSILAECIDEDDDVLDVGGGTGHFTIPLAKMGHRMCLLELSPDRCRTVAETAAEYDIESNVRVVNGDMRSMAFAENTFDVIVCLGRTLSHVGTDPSDGLEEFNRVGREESTLVTTVVNRTMDHNDLSHALLRHSGEKLVEKLERLAENKRRQKNLHQDSYGDLFKFSVEEITETLEATGFEVLETHAMDRHSTFMSQLLSDVWDDSEKRNALLEYENTVGQLPWFHNSGNMILQVSRLDSKL